MSGGMTDAYYERVERELKDLYNNSNKFEKGCDMSDCECGAECMDDDDNCDCEECMNTEDLSYGAALYLLQQGERVARAGWNGKGMWLILVGKDDYEVTPIIWNSELLPWIGMKTADNKFVPWLCSQTDMMASDWCVVNSD